MNWEHDYCVDIRDQHEGGVLAVVVIIRSRSSGNAVCLTITREHFGCAVARFTTAVVRFYSQSVTRSPSGLFLYTSVWLFFVRLMPLTEDFRLLGNFH